VGLEQRNVRHGTEALEALRAAVDELQEGDPLRPITVVVPSNSVGVAARRWLARNGGIAATQFLTMYRLAELRGAAQLAAAGRRPVSSPVIDHTVRSVLRRTGRGLRVVADHPATIEGFRATYSELRQLDDEYWQLLRLGSSSRGREVLDVAVEVRRRLAVQWYDERDLIDAALADERAHTAGIVVHLPDQLPAAHRRLVEHLAGLVRVIVITPHTDVRAHTAPSVQAVSVTDADEEAREAVRQIVQAAQLGTPFESMAIVWPVAVPYARIVTEQLTRAGVAWNGRPGVELTERLPARLALGWLRVDRRGLRRTDLFDLLSHCPARRRDGRPVPVAAFERVCRQAGVHGAGDWADRLHRYAAARRVHDPQAATAQLADEVADFVEDLVDALGPRHLPRPPSHWAGAVDTTLRRWLGLRHDHHPELAEADVSALEALERILHRLHFLDDALGPMQRAEFADLLEGELQAAPSRVGRLGNGVQVGPVSYALGQPLELLVMVGVAEGLLPCAPPPGGLLTDRDRALVDGLLPLVADRVDEQIRHAVAAVAGASRVVLTVPRGDLRASSSRTASRLLNDLRTTATVEDIVRPSYAHTMLSTDTPATPADLSARELFAMRLAGKRPDTHPQMVATGWLARAVVMSVARREPYFTEYDGYLPNIPAAQWPLSATGLERWARCPWHFFVTEVLGVRPLDDPELSDTLSPRDRGSLLHETLDDLHQAVLRGDLPQPTRGWAPEHAAFLSAAYSLRADDIEARGLSGRRALWTRERRRRWRDLEAWLQIDGQRVAESSATIVASEVRIGSPDPFEVRLPSGRTLALRGTIDRLDRDAAGLVVIDHKTGSITPVSDADPTHAGRALQLALYAMAAPALVDEPDLQVRARYAQVGSSKTAGFTATPDVLARVDDELERILAGIDHGVFVADPQTPSAAWGRPPCAACDPDGMGTGSLFRRRASKVGDPRVAAYLEVEVDNDD
jgi:ATP-dependent helicase/nuclease subunit B